MGIDCLSAYLPPQHLGTSTRMYNTLQVQSEFWSKPDSGLKLQKSYFNNFAIKHKNVFSTVFK